MDKIRRLIFIRCLCFSFSFVNFVFMFNSPAAYFYSLPFFSILFLYLYFPRLFAYPLETKTAGIFCRLFEF